MKEVRVMAKGISIIPKLSEKELSRFWSKINKNGPIPDHCHELGGQCWLWQAAFSKGGYGRFNIRRNGVKKTYLAHRIVYTLYYGLLANPTINVLHKCDNPPCCNFYHLFEGTNADNMADMVYKGRSLIGNRNPSHLHPESRPRGDRNPSRIYRERRPRGEQNKNSKLTEESIREIRRLLAARCRQVDIAAKFGVVQTTISEIKCNNLWAHVK